MGIKRKDLNILLIGFYAWTTAVFFGGILIDSAYTNLVSRADTAFREMSDILLLIGFVTLIASLGAITVARKSAVAGKLFIASLLVIIFEFFIPVFFSSFLRYSQGSMLTTGIRITVSGFASMLAFIGLYKYYRHK